MYVKDEMTFKPLTINPGQSVSEAVDLMKAKDFHRLPVVDHDNKLVGLVTETTISKNTPSSSSTLSVYELNYLLNKLTINDVMIKDPVSVGPEALLEEAATLMQKNDIGCLPVVDEENKVVGIITHKDIFNAFVKLLGYHQKNGTRYVINISKDKVGVMEDIAHCFVEEKISISNLAVYNTSRGIEVVVIASGRNSGKCGDRLKAQGYNVTSIMKLKKEA